MPVNKPHLYEQGVYFITFTNYRWLSLFELTNSYDLIYKWFDAIKQMGCNIVGYVIMPNHVHVMIAYSPCAKSINTIVGNGKRFIAYELINRLRVSGDKPELLKKLADCVSVSDKKKGKLHEVFEPSFECNLCYSQQFINQKLSYLHANPVSKKWVLAADSISYKHSSAQFYETGVQGIYHVLHYMEWEAWALQ